VLSFLKEPADVRSSLERGWLLNGSPVYWERHARDMGGRNRAVPERRCRYLLRDCQPSGWRQLGSRRPV
jgi:hypothetical protein